MGIQKKKTSKHPVTIHILTNLVTQKLLKTYHKQPYNDKISLSIKR